MSWVFWRTVARAPETNRAAENQLYFYSRSSLIAGDFLQLAPATDPGNQRRFDRRGWILRGGVHGLPFRAG